jgi:outer membrane protein OmpU
MKYEGKTMKKVLFATTALVATAGVASADVALSGSAEMGIYGGTDMETQFHTDIDVTFTMSGTTDNGLTFGASIDLDESDGSGSIDFECETLEAGVDLNGGGVIGVGDDYSLCDEGEFTAQGNSNAFDANVQGGETIFLSGDFGTITMGDTDGAFDWALTEITAGNAGSIQDNETGHNGYNGNSGLDGTYDGQILRYDYTAGDFGVAVSLELDDDSGDDPVMGVGFRYGLMVSGGTINFGLGYQSADDDHVLGVSVSAAMDMGLTATINYAVDQDDDTYMGIGIGYTVDAITVYANYAENFDEDDGWGFAAAYDLGGGASLHFGYGSDDDKDTWSLGASMSF